MLSWYLWASYVYGLAHKRSYFSQTFRQFPNYPCISRRLIKWGLVNWDDTINLQNYNNSAECIIRRVRKVSDLTDKKLFDS